MNIQNNRTTNNMTVRQKETLLQFKNELAHILPKTRIAWAKAFNEDIIELHLEYDRDNYKNSLKAATLATDIADKTDVTIVLL
jgi:hypothetical protein